MFVSNEGYDPESGDDADPTMQLVDVVELEELETACTRLKMDIHDVITKLKHRNAIIPMGGSTIVYLSSIEDVSLSLSGTLTAMLSVGCCCCLGDNWKH